MHSDPALQAALERCRATFREPAPCLDRDYLLSRHDYHILLVARGLLDLSLAEAAPLARTRLPVPAHAKDWYGSSGK